MITTSRMAILGLVVVAIVGSAWYVAIKRDAALDAESTTATTTATTGADTTAATTADTAAEPTGTVAETAPAPPSPAPLRPLGVVLIDPLIDDALNVREWPGTSGPILGELHRTQTKVIPTGRTAPVDGSPWREVTAGTVTGWVHGRYVTELWTADELDTRWDWHAVVDSFADVLAAGSDLTPVATWRGFYVVDTAGGLHWWRPDRMAGLLNDSSTVAWEGEAARHGGPPITVKGDCVDADGTWDPNGAVMCHSRETFAGLVAAPLLDVYHHPARQIKVGAGQARARTEGISTAFANFPWIAMSAPSGIDQTVTWLIFVEPGGSLPQVVGVQYRIHSVGA